MIDELIGTVWKSTDPREERWVRVYETDERYAYVATCDPSGVVHERPRRTRVMRTNTGGPRGYRPVEKEHR